MILQALVRCYDALAEAGRLEKPGWSPVKVSLALELDENGALLRVLPLGETDEKGKRRPPKLNVPAPVKRSSGVASNFLCDNAIYILGMDSKGRPERTAQCRAACREKHEALLSNVEHPMARAIVRFFANWDPTAAGENPALAPYMDELAQGANLVFCMDSEFAQDVPALRQAWDDAYGADETAARGRCLVTGEEAPIALLHPSIKGVMGANPTGASLVSFNARAYESYGRDEAQGLNAPVGERAAFAYGAALNYLLSDRTYNTRLGETTLVYWAEGAEEGYNFAMSCMLGLEDNLMRQEQLKGVMDALCSGRTAYWDDIPLNPDNRFYILGLAPNSARLSVRFFLQNSFGGFAEKLNRHQEELKIVRPSDDLRETLPVWALLRETANPNSRDKNPPGQLVGETMRAILTGAPYPASLFTQVQMRIRAEHEINRGKAAVIKAWLLRNVAAKRPEHVYKEVLRVKLNDETTYQPYLLGRLFAVLEGLQQAANPGINTTIRDRYFNSACATPAMVFPALVRLAQAHLNKLEIGLRRYYEDMIKEICGAMEESLPAHMALQDQGVFQLGYYHQKQKLYTKKEEKNNV